MKLFGLFRVSSWELGAWGIAQRCPGGIALLLLLAALPGCRPQAATDRAGPAAGHRDHAQPRVVSLFAAASTVDAVREIAERFEHERPADLPEIKVRMNFAASSTLAQQIAHGAPADLFLSASDEWADYLAGRGLVARRADRLGNSLVVVVGADSSTKLESLADLASNEIKHLAMADPEAVPAGKYGRAALKKLGLWERLRTKVVSGLDARQTLTFVERGAAEAGIVYATDAAASKAVRVALAIEADATGPIRYPLVLLKAGAARVEARAFYDYLAGPVAAAVFERHGFLVLPPQGGPQAP